MVFGRLIFIVLVTLGLMANLQSSLAEEPTSDYMREWAANAAVDILSYSHKQSIEDKMVAIQPYFTDKGFESYQRAAERSQYYHYYKNNSLEASATSAAGELPVANIEDHWRVVVPVTIKSDDGKPEQNYFLTLNTIKNEVGQQQYQIDQFMMGTTYISADCEVNSMNSQKMISQKLEAMNFISRSIFMKQAEADPSKVEELLSDELIQGLKACRN